MESPLMLFTSPLFYKTAPENCPGKDIPIWSSLQPHCRPLQPLQRAGPSYCTQQAKLFYHFSPPLTSPNCDPISLPCTKDPTERSVLYDSIFKTNQQALDPDLFGFQNFSANCLCLNLTACIQGTMSIYSQSTKLLLKQLSLNHPTRLDSVMACCSSSPVPCCFPQVSAKGNQHAQAGHQGRRQDSIAIPSPLLTARQIYLGHALCF